MRIDIDKLTRLRKLADNGKGKWRSDDVLLAMVVAAEASRPEPRWLVWRLGMFDRSDPNREAFWSALVARGGTYPPFTSSFVATEDAMIVYLLRGLQHSQTLLVEICHPYEVLDIAGVERSAPLHAATHCTSPPTSTIDLQDMAVWSD
ncbi:MAG TPA: hypothetical protein VD963_08415 [Phycisphaerales bacterium]|nr:hypothetical protein [Phycisphaerales bacterium]